MPGEVRSKQGEIEGIGLDREDAALGPTCLEAMIVKYPMFAPASTKVAPSESAVRINPLTVGSHVPIDAEPR